MEHRDKQIAERPLGLLLDEAAVLQAEVAAPGENGRVVAGVVGRSEERRVGKECRL